MGIFVASILTIQPQSTSMNARTILCFGDSNTWGFIPGADGGRYAPEQRWPGVMQEALGEEFAVIEEGQNGRMTVWNDPMETGVSKCGLDHLPVVLETHKPLDLVIIMLGTNDLKSYMGHSATSIAQGAITLADLVLESDSGVKHKAPKVLLVCPAAVSEGHCPFWHLFDGAPETSKDMPAAYEELARDRGIPFLNAGDFAVCPEPDCIHLDEVGHASLGAAMADKVKSIFS